MHCNVSGNYKKTYSVDKEKLHPDNINLPAQGILTCTLKGFQCTLRKTGGVEGLPGVEESSWPL